MSGIQLYNYDLDENCYRVRLALSMLGIACKTVAMNAFPGNEHKAPAFLAINPLGTLPVLKDEELTLFGAEAILCHLARAHGGDTGLLPAHGDAYAQVMQWLFFSAGELSVTVEARGNALLDQPGDAVALRAGARRVLRVMDDHMTARGHAGADWFVGEHATLADIALFPAFALSRDYGVDHDEYPALRRWGRRFRTLPGFLTMPGIPDYH